MIFDLTHVKHDPAHCLAPGLFRSLKKGERRDNKLSVTYTYGNDRLEFSGPEPLGVDDLRVMQGLIAMAAVSGNGGIMLRKDTQSHDGRQLRLLLDLKWDALENDAMVAKGSFGQLAKELGYTVNSGGVFKVIRSSIERLWKVSVIVESDGKRHGFRLLSSYESDEKNNKLFVAINPRIADAIVGTRPHVRMDMSEIRSLKTDSARLIHQRLCAWINPGDKRRVDIDTLCSYVWPDKANESTLRKRHQNIRKAINELQNLNWKIDEHAKNKFLILRSKIQIETPEVSSKIDKQSTNPQAKTHLHTRIILSSSK